MELQGHKRRQIDLIRAVGVAGSLGRLVPAGKKRSRGKASSGQSGAWAPPPTSSVGAICGHMLLRLRAPGSSSKRLMPRSNVAGGVALWASKEPEAPVDLPTPAPLAPCLHLSGAPGLEVAPNESQASGLPGVLVPGDPPRLRPALRPRLPEAPALRRRETNCRRRGWHWHRALIRLGTHLR